MRGFICGFVVSALVFSTAAIGFAATGSQTITAAYNNIKIYVGQKLVTPKDASGNVVEPFIYNGTTYLPVRAVGEALGQEVYWDNATKSVYIGGAPAKENPAANQILVEKNGIKITYLGTKKSSSYLGGYEIQLKVENTAAKNYTVQIRDFSANGIMCDTICSIDVAAGKTAIDRISVPDYALEEIGQTTMSESEFYFHIFDADTWSDSFDTEIIRLAD